MAWFLPALIGAGIGMAASKAGKERKPSVQKFETLTPEQKRVAEAFEKYLTPRIGKGVETYTEPVVAGITPSETAALSRLRTLTGTQYPEVTSTYLDYLKGRPLYEISPDITKQYYEEAIAKPAIREYKERILPLIEEGYIGGPGYWSSPRALARERALEDLSESLLAKRAELVYSDELSRRKALESAAERALTAGRGLRELTGEEFTRAKQTLQAEALPRILEQAQLDWNYREFLRTRPESAPYLQYALQFLGIPMMGYVGFQGREGILPELIKGAATVAAAAINA